ncbi:MAG: aminomethyl-transferring glycine dehydrogenase subunit GcvPA [Candidatus Lokiarchaeota archaeon]|nr:aminomethyl-transferring glycine dehydrogenase subunit GcvPA [Candidatus Lokiarchaeota archaeon]
MSRHQYIPNSVPEIKREMLEEIGIESVDELFASIPESIRFKGTLDLPPQTPEMEVQKHVSSILGKNTTGREMLSFLGGGCWQHYVPAACDEINARSEFLTAYTGDVYSDLGRYQALWEFQSMIGELVSMDAVSFPTYSWATAAGDAVRMAAIVAGRDKILLPETVGPYRLSVIKSHCSDLAEVVEIPKDPSTGGMNLSALEKELDSDTAAIYLENPSYYGFIETQAPEIGELAHEHGALFTVGVEPLSLGLIQGPGDYGADIVCGEGQPLGLHPSFGGALLGFLTFKDKEEYMAATGHRIITITTTQKEGEKGFAYVLPHSTMFGAREKAASYTGTATVLWAITAAVYMSLLGPKGITEIAQTIAERTKYATKRLSEIEGIQSPIFSLPHFKDFTVNFTESGKTVEQVNKALLKHGIQGGKDLEYEGLDNTALYSVTEIHTKEDIDKLAHALEEVL